MHPSSGRATALLACFVLLLSPPASSFKAAVFEHAQQSYASSSQSPEDIVRENLHYYATAAAFAGSQGVRLIVFPEYGLFPPSDDRAELRRFLEPVPDPPANPCLQPDPSSPVLGNLSCLARRHGLVLLANVGELQPCPPGSAGCPDDGAFHFNANVAFDGEGRILAKYRKEHLFEEPAVDLPPPGQDPTFDSPLGRLASFVCFDALFRGMAEAGRLRGVRAVLLPTMWLNSGPLFSAPQYFEAWAVGSGATLLAANVQLPGRGAVGSVIAAGRRGALVYTFNPDGRSKLLLADLGRSECSPGPESALFVVSRGGVREWKDDGVDVGEACSERVLGPPRDLYRDYRCLERDLSQVALTRLSSASGRAQVCSGGVCCELEYEAEELRGEYCLGAFNGSYAAGSARFAEEDCFVARCEGATFPTRAATAFRRVALRGRFSTDFVFPSLLESGMRLTPSSQWAFEKKGGVATVAFRHAPGKRLLAVGLKARPFERDPPRGR